MPLDWLGGAIAKVFFQRAAEAQLEGNIALVVEGVFSRLVTLGMLPMVMLSMVGRDAFAVVFGSNWAEAGVYAQILAMWTFFWFISSPLSALFSILEKQEYLLRINFAILGTRLISLIVGGLLNDVRLALFLFGGTGVIVYAYLGIVIMSEAGVAWATTGKILISNFLLSLPAIAMIGILRLFDASSAVVLIVTGLLLLAYLTHRVMTDHQLRTGLLDAMRVRGRRDS
jgi:O-antigen/teichoic acid export membrane protein